MVICQSEKPNGSRPSALSFLAISLAPLHAASTFGKSSSRSGTVVVLFENSTLNFGISKGNAPEAIKLRQWSGLGSGVAAARTKTSDILSRLPHPKRVGSRIADIPESAIMRIQGLRPI